MRLSRLPIVVEQRDIARALRNSSSKCVVATAIARAVPDATRIDVDQQTCRFSVGNDRYVYLTPWRVQDYIVAFDAGVEIEPFRFQLRDPQVTARSGAKLRVQERSETDQELGLGDAAEPNKRVQPKIKSVPRNGGTAYTREGGRVPPRGHRGYRTHTRAYGARVMRINQVAEPAA